MNLFKFTKNSGYASFARTMDWALAWASIPLAAWLVWRSWPQVDSMGWISVAAIPVAFAMAFLDWQKSLDEWLRRWIIRRN
jgi:hypothetical protein